MSLSSPLSTVSARDLVDLAWELTCSAGIVVKIDEVVTEHGVECCVSARCVPGVHPFMLIPRGPEFIEVWWGAHDDDLTLIGMAADLESVMALAAKVAE